MDEVGNNLIKGIDFSYLAKNDKKTQKEKPPEQKTGDLGAYLDNVGSSGKFFIKKESMLKKEKALKEELVFLKNNYSKKISKNDQILEDFHFLVRQIPLPTKTDVLDGISLDEYLRKEALKLLDKFEAYMEDSNVPMIPENADEVRMTAYKEMNSAVEEGNPIEDEVPSPVEDESPAPTVEEEQSPLNQE